MCSGRSADAPRWATTKGCPPCAPSASVIALCCRFLLFLLNGIRLPRHEVAAGISNHRLLWPLVGWVFGAMGLAGWLLWQGGQGWMPHLLALGFLYLGCLPSTVQSATAYSSLAGGNVASSVVAAALLNILGVFITAPLFSLLAGSGAAEFRAEGLIKVVTILLIPFLLGQALQGKLGAWVAGHRPLVTWMDRTSIAIAVYVAFSGAVVQRFWERIDAAGWAWLAGGTRCFWSSAISGPGWLAARSGSIVPTGSASCLPVPRKASRWGHRWQPCYSRPLQPGSCCCRSCFIIWFSW